MKSLSKLLLISALAAGTFAPAASAETAKWVIEPKYDEVTQFSSGFYKAKNGNRTTIYNRDGDVLLASVDSVTPFTEGLALVLSNSHSGQMQLRSILHEDGSVVGIAGEDVFVKDYPFFSEGLLPVTNAKGKAGYMDANGIMVLPFKYSNPHPFSNGLAAVSKGKGILSKAIGLVGMSDIIGSEKVFYINKAGAELKLPKMIGDIYFGSTFKDGEALVVNKERQYCIINTGGMLVRIEQNIKLNLDRRNALADEDDEEKPATPAAKPRPDGPTPFGEGQLYGYRKGTEIVLPVQFTSAEPFVAKRAIASRFKAYGLLGLIEGDVNVIQKPGSKAATGSDMQSVDLEVSLPAAFAYETIEVEVNDKDNKIVAMVKEKNGTDARCMIPLMLPKGDRTIRVKSEGIELWNSRMAASGEEKSSDEDNDDVTFAFSASKLKANSKDAAAMTVTIVNNSGSTLSAPVALSGASSPTKKVSIPSGGKKTVSIYFSNITKVENRTVTITVGDYSASRRISLQPFFNF